MTITERKNHKAHKVDARHSSALAARLIAHVNRKNWWHVPPCDAEAYRKRGKFLASSFRDAEFWGRPLDEPQKVKIQKPLIGDEDSIEKLLFGQRVSTKDITLEERWALDTRLKRVAIRKGYDSIVLLSDRGHTDFIKSGKIPRSIELNILNPSRTGNRPASEKRRLKRAVK